MPARRWPKKLHDEHGLSDVSRRPASALNTRRKRSRLKEIAALQHYYFSRYGQKPITLPRLIFMRDLPKEVAMCDYSLMHAKSRPAAVADKLTVRNFGMGTRGFCSTNEGESDMAVCVLPGTEIAFAAPIQTINYCVWGNGESQTFEAKTHDASVARFRQFDVGNAFTHHDAIELPDGTVLKLTHLLEGQEATVLQLPAAPKTETEAEAQKRVEVVG
jgi:hypothetical protein